MKMRVFGVCFSLESQFIEESNPHYTWKNQVHFGKGNPTSPSMGLNSGPYVSQHSAHLPNYLFNNSLQRVQTNWIYISIHISFLKGVGVRNDFVPSINVICIIASVRNQSQFSRSIIGPSERPMID